MAIIDNHKQVKIDKAFSDKHVEMFAFFDSKGIDVEVSDNFKDFQHFLTHLSPDDYPYRYDISFNDDNLDLRDDTYANNAFALYLKKDNKIIATYAAKELGFSYFVRVRGARNHDFFAPGGDFSDVWKRRRFFIDV